MYDYTAPPGWGDTFFQYVFDADGAGLTDGQSYFQKGVPVQDGQFVLRYWSGLGTLAEGLQIYDWLGRRFASEFMTIGAGTFGNQSQMVILPEVVYPENGNIRFDLQTVAQSLIGEAKTSQLVFTGVRRRKGVVSDPVPSSYRYYEKDFSIPYTLTVPASGTTQFTVPITDFDFELRRMELQPEDEDFFTDSGFKILLYDTNWQQVSNIPVLANSLFHLNGGDPAYEGQLNFWPCPPMLYRVNSVIRFDVTPITGAGEQEYQVLFKGVRRIPCS